MQPPSVPPCVTAGGGVFLECRSCVWTPCDAGLCYAAPGAVFLIATLPLQKFQLELKPSKPDPLWRMTMELSLDRMLPGLEQDALCEDGNIRTRAAAVGV